MKSTLILLCLFFSLTGLQADPIPRAARTNENTLNDLVRNLPFLSISRQDELQRLSAIQELLYLYERTMRGEGLPQEMALEFSTNYSAILSALVDDRVTEEFGREMLSIHRQLIEKTHLWLGKRIRKEDFPTEVVENLHFFQEQLCETAIPLQDVVPSIRTPIINGYQAWLGELLAWGCESGTLSAGARSRIQVKADDLERFEGYYKNDGVLQPYEREQLHARFLKLTRETIAVLAR
ncbi:MAG: hypothetical protein KA250_09455 [Verrucomicrobiales bacterium]|jgi:hypothetical protein|nr:hypothetical protein [Verrucomicrobiales bacterium]MBP9223413.1 hypothetical protein [Verrucomicrobiales bacterium]